MPLPSLQPHPVPPSLLGPLGYIWPVVPIISFDFVQVWLSNLYIRNTFFLVIITNTHHFRAIGMYRKASRNRKTTSAIVLLP